MPRTRVGLREVMIGIITLAAISSLFRGLVLELISGPARPSEQPIEAYRPSGKVILDMPLPKRRYVAGDDIPPTSHALPLTNVFRDDVVSACLTPQEALGGAPEVEEQRFRVPRILGEEQ